MHLQNFDDGLEMRRREDDLMVRGESGGITCE